MSSFAITTRHWRDFLGSAIRSDAGASLLTHRESDAIKGFLIILIVLGHDKYVQMGGMNNLFLYSFHVYAFYYLPFLYDFRPTRLMPLIRKNLVRLYVPYTLVFALLFAIACVQGKMPGAEGTVLAYVCGSQMLLSKCFGFGSFLWFIPTMFSVLVWRWIYYRLDIRWRCVMLVASGVCLVGFAYMIRWYVATWFYSPLCLTVALGMVLPGVILREICTRLKAQVATMAFFLLVIAIMVIYPVRTEYHLSYLTINRLVCPVLIFSLLLSMRGWLAGSKWLVEFGRLSFRIYLIHIFIYNAAYMVLDRQNPGIYVGLCVFAVAFVGAWLLAKIPLMRYAFPR